MFSRVAERALSSIAWAVGMLLVLGGAYAIYQMPAETKAAIWAGIWRTAAWVAIAAALPWSSRLFIRRVLEIGSNWAAAGLIAGLLVADIIAGLALMNGLPGNGWMWFLSLTAVGLAGTYNYLVTEYVAQQAGG